jgi:Chaperone of endosialidase
MSISLSGSLLLTGSIVASGNLTTTGTITAQTLVVQTITSSIVNITGSNIFGSQLSDRQTFTGSLFITGSSANFSNQVCGLMGNFSCIGIGMTSPQAPLHLIRSLGSDVISIGESGTNTRLAIGQEASYTGNYINSRNIDLKLQTYCSGGSGGSIYFQTGTDGTACVTTKMFLCSNGNVGIGTSSPFSQGTGATSLEVVGSIYGQLYVNGSGGAAARGGFMGRGGGFGDVYLAAISNAPLVLGTNDTERMRITCGGNVGIGTSSPGTRLEVLSRAADADRTLPVNVLTLTAEQCNFPYNPFGAAILFKNRSYASGLVESARIRSVIYDDGAPANCGGGIWLETTRTPGGTLTPSLVVNYAGFVGVGTTSPSEGYLTICQQCASATAGTAPYGLYITGREVYNPGSENAGGITIGMGVNRSQNRQLWIKSTDNAVNGTNALFRIQPNNQQIALGSVSTNGDTATCLAINASCVLVNGVGVGGASDERVKDNIVDLNYGLASVMCLKPRTFKFKGDCNKTHIGFVAQEVACVVPEFVVHDTSSDVNSIFGNVTLNDIYRLEMNGYVWSSLLVKAIQEQQCTINTLKTCIGIA